MYTEYNSEKSYNNENYVEEKPNRFLGVVWKILLVVIVLILLFLSLFQFGVISLNSSVSPEVILLNQNEIGIKKGSGYQLLATVLPEDASNKRVIWESSDPKVVSVNETTGYINGLKEGSAIVTVKTVINEIINECIVNVEGSNILVNNISVNEKYINLAVGYTHSLSYRTLPKNATELSLKFISSDPSVATVNSKGIITGVKEGSAIITVSSGNGNISDTSYITVYKKGTSTTVGGESIATKNYPKSVALNEENLNLKVGSSSQLLATISPSNVNQSVSWSSSNTNVATVDENGLVVARGVGSAIIVAKTINGLTDSCKVVVGNYSVDLKGVRITTEYAVLPIGIKKQLVAVFEPSNATNKTVIWSSSNTSVATVDASGIVSTISPGTATITVTSSDGGYKAASVIEVINPTNTIEITGVEFSQSTYSVAIGGTISLNPIVYPTNATYKAVSFESSDPSVATVDENGIVKGIKKGSAKITVTTKRNNKKAVVTVNVNSVSVSGIELNATNINITKGNTYSLQANILPSLATNKKVTWSSSNTSIATVDSNGIVKGINSGTTTIVVTTEDGLKNATCVVTVN